MRLFVVNPLKGLEHDDRVSANDLVEGISESARRDCKASTYHHADRDLLTPGLFLESLIKDNVHEDLTV